jgi:uncharacterized membrane protein
MSTKVAAWVFFLLLVAPAFATNAAALGQGVQWFGPTGNVEGYHFRVALTVRNNHAFPVTNAPAFVELDIAERLTDAGWISKAQGDRDVLKSFKLDAASFRVVEVTDLLPASSGPSHGRTITYDAAFSDGAERRYEVPSQVLPGALRAAKSRPFDAATNPVVTIIWRVEGTLQPFATSSQERSFVVYFDSTQNGEKNPSTHADQRGGGALDALFWTGQGLTLYGNVAPAATEVGTVRVIPLHDSTSVSIRTLSEAGTFQPVSPPAGYPSYPVTMSAFRPQELFVASGRSAVFRVDASKPVIAFVDGTGFVPSTQGALTGTDFVFPLNQPQGWEQDSIYFVATGTNETIVKVRPVTGPGEFTFTMNSIDNPRPNTVGARAGLFNGPAGTGACFVRNPNEPSPLLTSPGYYRAVVTKGDPVLLQIASSRGMSQVPSALGAPSGTTFHADLGWTDLSFNHLGANPQCNDTTRTGSFIATSIGDASEIRATNDQWQGQVYPLGRDPSRLPPPAIIGPMPAGYDGPQASPLLDRPVTFAGSRPFALFAGIFPPITGVDLVSRTFGYPDMLPVREATGTPPIQGPVGGADFARTFATFGPSTIVALFNGTSVEADLQFTGSGRSAVSGLLGANGILSLDDRDETDQLHGVRVDSNLPLIVIPRNERSAALAAVPAFLDAIPRDAEFRGHLVKISSRSGLNPVTDSTLPGVAINYTLDVTNLGHGIGGANLPDTIQIATTAPSGWTARVDRQSLFLQTAQSAQVQVTVVPPPNLNPGAIGQVTVRAQSGGNPNMADDIELVTLIKRSFGVGLWFDQVGNPQRTRTQFASRTAEATYTMVVKNTGAVTDTIRLTVTDPGEPGWDVRLRTVGGATVDRFLLEAGKTAKFVLAITTSPTTPDATIISAVTAQSVSEPAAQDQLVAITKLRSPSNVQLTTPDTSLLVLPGDTAFFPIILKNTGAGSAELVFSTQNVADPGWNLTGVVTRDDDGEPGANITELSLAPGQTAPLWFAATPNITSLAGSFAQSQISVRVAGTTQTLEAILQATVFALHKVDAAMPPLPLLARTGSTNLSATVRLTNNGNLNETLTIRASDLPAGWQLVAPTTLSVARGASQDLVVKLVLPTTAAPATYNVTIGLEAEDGNVTFLKLPTVVGALASAGTIGAESLLGRPGRWTATTFPVRNDGNVPIRVEISSRADEPWRWDSPHTSVVLPPGAQISLAIAFFVPPDAPDGSSQHAVGLALKPQDPTAPTMQRGLVATIAVARPDLAISDAEAFKGPAGLLVRTVVRNLGPRAADNVSVELQLDDRIVDAVMLDEIPAGASGNVTLLVADGQTGTLRVLVDRGDSVVEKDETNNAKAVGPVAAAKESPAPGAALVALALAWIATRRRRPGPS